MAKSDYTKPVTSFERSKPTSDEGTLKSLRESLKDAEPEYRKPTPVGRFGIIPMGYKNRGFNRFMYTWVVTDRMRYYRGQLKTKSVPMSDYAKELLEGTFAKW